MQDVFKLSDRLIFLRDYKDSLEIKLKDCKEEIDETELKMIELMVSEEVQSFKKDNKTFYLKSRLFASIPGENKDLVIEWFKSSDDCDLVKEQINANSLSSWVKERMDEDDMPKDLGAMLNIYEKTSVGVRTN